MKFLSLLLSAVFCVGAIAQCNPPPEGWVDQPISDRVKLADSIALVKVLAINNRRIESYGETYDVTVTRLCSIKANRGTIFPLTFTITQMGDRDNDCPDRHVIEGVDYIIFLKKGEEAGTFTPHEINQQQCIWETTDENFKLFPGQLNHCYLQSGCAVRNGSNWRPMSPRMRAEAAEIIVKVRITEIHYITSDPATSPYHASCELQCVMKQPTEVAPLPKNFNTTGFGFYSGQCSERLVTKGHDFIMLLTRYYVLPPLIGATVPPDLLENYFLSPQEVNQQQAVFNVTETTIDDFDDLLKDCPGAAAHSRVSKFTFISVIVVALWQICI